ncbi:MAG: hypothetical protein KUG77_14285 [Nannocystaceae bacterium]|nr:hypothetical protein [Nannocystaceae bacterium]
MDSTSTTGATAGNGETGTLETGTLETSGSTGEEETATAEACAPSPCPAGAECTLDGPDGFVCDCTQGGSGRSCDLLPECGNGLVEHGEECDEDVSPTCSASCIACVPPVPQALINQELAACFEGSQSDCRAGWAYNGNSSIQAFQVTTEGHLETIELNISNDDPSAEMTVHLVDGGADSNFPSGASNAELVNATLGLAVANGLQDTSWVAFDFSDEAIDLDPTHHYFIWQRQVAPLPSNLADRFRWNLWTSPEVPDPYPAGRSFFCPANQGCSSQPLHWDFAFRVEMTPAPPLCGA